MTGHGKVASTRRSVRRWRWGVVRPRRGDLLLLYAQSASLRPTAVFHRHADGEAAHVHVLPAPKSGAHDVHAPWLSPNGDGFPKAQASLLPLAISELVPPLCKPCTHSAHKSAHGAPSHPVERDGSSHRQDGHWHLALPIGVGPGLWTPIALLALILAQVVVPAAGESKAAPSCHARGYLARSPPTNASRIS